MKRTALRRKAPMRRANRASSYAQRPRDYEYMAMVRKLPCAVRAGVGVHHTRCGGRIEADHMGERPVGRKAADDTCVPLCSVHHRERTNLFGVFAGWTRPQMRQWCDAAITSTRHEVSMMKQRAAT